MRPLISMESDELLSYNEPPKENVEIEMPVVHELEPQVDPASAVDSDESDNDREVRPIPLRRSTRVIKPPGEWWKVRQSTPVIASDSEDDEDEDANVVVSGEIEPASYKEAMIGPQANKWKDAALEEYNWHLQNGTWELVELPPEMKAIGSKWVFKIKHNADGSIERFKARLVAKGFSQRPGQDYFETFASTMRHTTIRTVLALAAINDLELRSVDISHAFTNSDVDAEIYMKQPEGFEQGG